MKKIENECYDCRSVGLPCLGSTCPHRNVERFYCDRCEEEGTLYRFEDEEICIDCLLKEFEVVEGSDW